MQNDLIFEIKVLVNISHNFCACITYYESCFCFFILFKAQPDIYAIEK